MKQSPHHKDLHSRLASSMCSADGFLGTDKRTVDEIINDDMRMLDGAGVSRETLVQELHTVYNTARDAFGAEAEIRPGVVAVFHESMGKIPSPFRGDGVFAKGEAVIFEYKTGRQLVITALGINLIEKHGFFQGKGCRYRIDPVTAIEILGLSHSQ
jgi:hypothetical protein